MPAMNKHLVISTIILLSFSSLLIANELQDNRINFIHSEMKNAMTSYCKKHMEGMSDAVCECLGNKAQANLDDNALKKCKFNKKDSHCIKKAAEQATFATLSKDTINACVAENKSAQPAPTPSSSPLPSSPRGTPVTPTNSPANSSITNPNISQTITKN